MIGAVEALRLPSAQLSADEQRQVAALLAEIETAVRSTMRRCGCEIIVRALNAAVIAELAITLKRAGWNPQWIPFKEPSTLTGGETRQVGYRLALTPSEAAYEAAREPLQ